MTVCRTRGFIIGAALAILASTPAARAESSLFFGVDFPTGDLANATTAGWSMGGYSTGNVLPAVAVGGFVAYNDFVVDTTVPGAGAQYGPTLNAWEIEAFGQVDILSLKGIIGLGIANYSGLDEEGESQRKTNFAWQIGVAARFYILEGQLVFHQISTEGVKPNWISLTAGILF